MALPIFGAAGKALFGTKLRAAGTSAFGGWFAKDTADSAEDYGLHDGGILGSIELLTKVVVALIVVFVVGQLININV